MMFAPIREAAFAAAQASPWYDRAAGSLPRVGEILVALIAAITLAGLARSVGNRTLNRRRDRYARFRRLGTNAQLSFFTSVLGEPPAMRRSLVSDITLYNDQGDAYHEPRGFIEAIWIDRDYYVHAYADTDETVVAYSVTTRSKRFRPKLRPPWGESIARGRIMTSLGRPYRTKRAPTVKLGKTRFSTLPTPQHASSWIGAHNWHYYEAVWGGNPGYYQWYVYSINDSGARAWDDESPWEHEMYDFAWGFAQLGDGQQPADPKLALQQAAIRAGLDQPDEFSEMSDEEFEASLATLAQREDDPLPAQWTAFRRSTRPNTYTIIAPALALDDYPGGGGKLWTYPVVFGASGHRVRTVAGDR